MTLRFHRATLTFAVLLLFCTSLVKAQSPCVTKNTAFLPGEELNYNVVYNWGMIWVESGHATFSVRPAQFQGKNCYLFNGIGSTYPKYDWFYKVKDVFESYVDTLNFRPLKFRADIWEGNKKERHTYIFNHPAKKVYTVIGKGHSSIKTDTVKIGACSIDVLTAIYYARNIDYSKCEINDTISISLLLDGSLYPIYVRYKGKAVYDAGELGKFNCIKFTPLLVEGSIFKKGESMVVWVTDDDNKIPLYIETPIIVGSIKVKLKSYKGLRYSEASKITKTN